MAVTIYRIHSSSDSFALLPSDQAHWNQLQLFQVERMAEQWIEPTSLYIRDPDRTKGTDFVHVDLGALAFKEIVLESDLGAIIERSGEILPAQVEGIDGEVLILNTIACYNCLDKENSKLRTTPDGSVVIQVEEYAFHPSRIGDQNLFKVPETKRTCIYAVTGRDTPEDEFYRQYISGGYTGLEFEQIWHGDWSWST